MPRRPGARRMLGQFAENGIQMIEVTFLIPVASNDGETFAAPHHEQFEAVLLDHFGGFTRLPYEAIGGWRDNTGTYHDHNLIYVVAVDGIITRGPELLVCAELAKRHYEQRAVMLRYLGAAEII